MAQLNSHPPCSPPARSVSECRFHREAQLSQVFQQAFSRDVDQWVWLPELESPNGIADLTAIRLVDTQNSPDTLALVPPRWVYALRNLPLGSPTTAVAFAASLNVTPNHARTILQRYEAAGFCAFEKSSRSWTKLIQPPVLADRIVAIELKLTDWKRALYQASRYLDFANQAWVVLDERSLDRAAAHLDAFAHRGIGLAGITPASDLHIEFSAVTRPPRLPGRFWHINAEIARRLTDLRLQVPTIESV